MLSLSTCFLAWPGRHVTLHARTWASAVGAYISYLFVCVSLGPDFFWKIRLLNWSAIDSFNEESAFTATAGGLGDYDDVCLKSPVGSHYSRLVRWIKLVFSVLKPYFPL